MNKENKFDAEDMSLILYDDMVIKCVSTIPIPPKNKTKDNFIEYLYEYRDVSVEYSKKYACDILLKIYDAIDVTHHDVGFLVLDDRVTLRNTFRITLEENIQENGDVQVKGSLYHYDLNFFATTSFN